MAALIEAVTSKLDSGAVSDFETDVVKGFFLKSTQEARQDVTMSYLQRVLTSTAAFFYLRAAGSAASDQIRNDIATDFLSLLFDDKEDAQVPEVAVITQ